MRKAILFLLLTFIALNSFAQTSTAKEETQRTKDSLYWEQFNEDTNFRIVTDYKHATFKIVSWKPSVDVEISRILGFEYFEGAIATGQEHNLKSWPDGHYLFVIKDFKRIRRVDFNYCCERIIEPYDAACMGLININLMERPDTASKVLHEIWAGESITVTGPPIEKTDPFETWYPVAYYYLPEAEAPATFIKGYIKNPLLKRPLGNEY